MNPPTEQQLVQDYLSRLSAAARGRLTPVDRRALVRRTLEFIEQNAGPVGSAPALEVGRLLSALGDPAAIVDQEQARLATARGETVEAPADGGRRARVLRRQSGQASWHWPSQPAGSPQLAHSLMAAADEPQLARPVGREALLSKFTDAARPARLRLHLARQESPRAPKVLRLVPADPSGNGLRPAIGAGGNTQGVATQAALPADLPARPSWPSVVARDAAEEEDQDGAIGRSLIVDRAGLVASWIAGRFRTQPVESAAVVLLGIGGAAYPPVWLLGAALALVSRVWDYRDKWAGLGLPVLLTVIGTVVGVCLTASHATTLAHDVHDGFMSADLVSRIMALLSASYLLWRAVRGRRYPVVPSWSKARKLS